MNKLEKYVDYLYKNGNVDPKNNLEVLLSMIGTTKSHNFDTWFLEFRTQVDLPNNIFALILKQHIRSLSVGSIFTDTFTTNSQEVVIKINFVRDARTDELVFNYWYASTRSDISH